ncbi:MAG: metallophosphoesterase family protein [Promethearchaeota archaeon]
MSCSFLLISDLAGKFPVIQPGLFDVVDFVVLAGDITLGARSEKHMARFFSKMDAAIPRDRSVYYIPGNHDYPAISEDHDWVPSNFVMMHDRTFIHEGKLGCPGILIVGFGGASMGLYNNFAFEEAVILEKLTALFTKAADITGIGEDTMTLLLLHDPPRDTVLDKNYRGEHVGSWAVRQIIEKYQPDIAVAGHIHESAGMDVLGRTICVNAGEGKQGKYAMIKINGKNDITVTLYPQAVDG